MVGKTAAEVARLAKDMYAALQRGTPTAPAPAPVAPKPVIGAAGAGVDANLIYRDANAYTEAVLAEATRRAQENLASAGASFVTPLASMARMHAKAHRPDIWNSYAPEIEATMATLPDASRGDVSTWQRVVDFVASQHVDEIAEKRAREIIARGGDTGTLMSGSVAGPSGIATMTPIRKLFSDNHPAIAGYKQDGLTPEMVIAQASKMGHTEEKYANMLTRRAAAVGGA